MIIGRQWCGWQSRMTGVGFDPTDLKPDHYGHAMMEEQAALVGGRFSITSSPGTGTAVEAVVPLTN